MILQFGKIPPPIGGISIHIQRLIRIVDSSSMKTELLDYSKERNLVSIFNKVSRSEIVHIHLSRKIIRLVFIIIFKILKKKVIVTFHGKYNFTNRYDYLSLKMASSSILLNEWSYNNAKKIICDKIFLIGAFIPPFKIEKSSLLIETKEIILNLNQKFDNVFCTNAWDVALDEDGREIYNGSLLLDLFKKLRNVALVFSDPKGNYLKYLKNKYKQIPENIHFINYEHDFTEVISLTKAVIRPTITDGDSLSVKEALFLQRDVISSDIVDRPKGCILYGTVDELENAIINFNSHQFSYKEFVYKNSAADILALYSRMLDQKNNMNKT